MSSASPDPKSGPPPLIKSVRLAGVGPFSFAGPQSKRDIELERLTLFVGPNSSGKSTILRAVGWLCDVLSVVDDWGLCAHRLESELKPLVNRRATSLYTELSASSEFDRVLLYHDSAPTTVPSTATIAALEVRGIATAYWVHGNSTRVRETLEHRFMRREVNVLSGASPALAWISQNYWTAGFRAANLSLNPDHIAEPSYFPGDTPEIRADGAYCASVLVELSLADRDRFDAVCDAIRTIIPDLRAIKFRREKASNGDNTLWGHQLVLDMASGDGIPAPAASEGTLLVIGLVTLLMAAAEPPNILLIDDIDRALHPRAQAEVMALLRRLMDERPELQILATSHSPYLLDHVDASEVRVTSVDHQTGEAMCARLTEHPDFDKWREMMSPGEFWSAVGEDWVLGQQGDRG